MQTDLEDDDDTLLERYRHGDQDAYAALVVRYHRPIYNAAFWILRRAEDASDVTQIVFLKVIEKLDDYDPQYRFFSWIYRIAVNEALNLQRRGAHQAPRDDDDAAALPARGRDTEADVGGAEQARHLQAALLALPVNARVVLSLRHFSECSYEEIADILALDLKTVKSRLFEARQRLRALLEQRRVH